VGRGNTHAPHQAHSHGAFRLGKCSAGTVILAPLGYPRVEHAGPDQRRVAPLRHSRVEHAGSDKRCGAGGNNTRPNQTPSRGACRLGKTQGSPTSRVCNIQHQDLARSPPSPCCSLHLNSIFHPPMKLRKDRRSYDRSGTRRMGKSWRLKPVWFCKLH
jgi:hypothetical protein